MGVGVYLPQEKHNSVAQSLWVVAGCGCGACVSVPGSRRFNIASISVGAERGGGACAGTSGSRRFSINSRSANSTEGSVTAATTCSVGKSVSSLTTYTGRADQAVTRGEAVSLSRGAQQSGTIDI